MQFETSRISQALAVVGAHVEAQFEKTDPAPEYGIYIVWFAKTLQNWKALVSTTLPDQMYYEVTFNGDKDEIYLDAYKKFQNVCIAASDVF